jgi:hypothetical protein
MNDKLAPPDAQAAAANVHSTEGQNIGHGHVFPRPDGVRARCGGPALCPACARDLARKNIEAGSSGGASGNHIADAGKMVASGAGTKPWCPNCEDRDPHCMACAGEGHKRKSSGEPSGSAEIRFVMGGNVYGRPTATDALDYADDRLQDPEEMQCCLTDARVKHMNAVRELLAGVTPEPGAKALGAAGYQMDETGFGTYKLTIGFPDMETLHAASDYVRRLRAAT